MKKRELVKLVVLVVDDSEAFDFGMGLKPCEHLVPPGKHLRVHANDRVKEGDALVFGPLVPHDQACVGDSILLLRFEQGDPTSQHELARVCASGPFDAEILVADESEPMSADDTDARTLMIQPWEATQLKEIEKAIMKSDLGIQPVNDGKVYEASAMEGSDVG